MKNVDLVIVFLLVAIFAFCVLTYLRCMHDRRRVDAVQDNGWQIGHIDGAFAVIGGSPRRVIGVSGPDVRKVIDRAVRIAEAQEDHRA